MNPSKIIIPAILRFLAALILLQTLYFKFTAHPDSVFIFSTLGLEPVGRIGTGILELLAAGLLIFRKSAWLGAILGLGLMSGAIFSHLIVLGIVVQGDGGQLFALAVITWVCCLGTIFFNFSRVPILQNLIREKR